MYHIRSSKHRWVVVNVSTVLHKIYDSATIATIAQRDILGGAFILQSDCFNATCCISIWICIHQCRHEETSQVQSSSSVSDHLCVCLNWTISLHFPYILQSECNVQRSIVSSLFKGPRSMSESRRLKGTPGTVPWHLKIHKKCTKCKCRDLWSVVPTYCTTLSGVCVCLGVESVAQPLVYMWSLFYRNAQM